MSKEKKPLRAIKRIKDREGVTKALVVIEGTEQRVGGTVRVVYSRHGRFSRLEQEKTKQEQDGLGNIE